MQAISVGEVYYLNSPFHSTVDPKHEKKLSYMLGTVSSRPVVVIRPPMWWDPYSEVTVLPALSYGDPTMDFEILDRYGYRNGVDYRFMIHTPHSIPVGRLGRYIGRLSDEECESMLYAFKWLHDPIMQKNEQVPKYLEEVWGTAIPMGPVNTKKHQTLFEIDNNMTIHTDDEDAKSLDGVQLDINLERTMTPSVLETIDNDPNYHVAEDKVDHKMIDVPKFPESVFSISLLSKYANRFSISDAFYTGKVCKKSYEYLNDDERRQIQGELTEYRIGFVYEVYKQFTPFDAIILGPKLPTMSLYDMLKNTTFITIGNGAMSIQEISALKRMCNILRDLSSSELAERVKALHPAEPETTEPATDENGQLEDVNDIRKALAKVKKYLNDRSIGKIPLPLQKEFLSIPEHAVRRAYTGKNFKVKYDLAVSIYQKIGA